jgi:RP/EB family microtubule-associated protein
MYPESIPMSKVNWAAKSDYEFVQNYKILQGGFNKHHVQRHVDVDKVRLPMPAVRGSTILAFSPR